MTTQPLEGLVVLDLSGTVATAYCGHLFASLGARVVDLEPPDGHPTRRIPPFAPGLVPRDASAFHVWISAGKESLELDLRSAAGRERLGELCRGADVLLEAFRPGELARLGVTAETLAAANPALLTVSISWFGQSGPLARAPGGDPIVASMAGAVRSFGPVEGPPMLPSGHGPQIVAGASAFVGALGHLLGRERSRSPAGGAPGGRNGGGVLDANVLEANLALSDAGTIGLFNACAVPPRLGWNRYWPTYPAGIYRASDGWIGVTAVLWTQWRSLCEMLDLPDLIAEPRYQITIERMADAELLDRRLAPALARRTVAEWFHEGQARRVPFAMVPTAEELLACEQFDARGAFSRYSLPDGATFRAPGLPFRLTSAAAVATPARSTAPAIDLPRRRAGCLAGVRVVDLTMGWAGPLAARHLADLGAEVIKVESCRHFDWWRGWDATPEGLANRIHEKSSAFNMVNRNKLGITLDLTAPRGIELVKRLVAESDVVVENYAATVLPKLGLGWEVLSDLKPGLVMLSMPPFGASGPWRGYRAYGSTVEQASGLPHLQGEEGDPPTMQHVALGDPIAGIYGAIALLVALRQRQRTGEGQRVDLSHVEALFAQGVSGFLEYEVLGRPAPRLGRRHREHAPHGVYPCAGADRWITITVDDDEQWRALGDLMAAGALPTLWPREERFAAAGGRKAHEDEIDRRLGEWTLLRDRDLLASKLMMLGVPAAPVLHAGEPLESPQLVARGFWQWIERAVVGVQPNPSTPFRAGVEPFGIDSPAPTLGEHNELVLAGVLGLSPREIDRLRADGVIGTEPVVATPAASAPA
jgi:crotonobetainyl-CoA:carnitine CoA-transferase CaiB-like acyl-CoA transferase